MDITLQQFCESKKKYTEEYHARCRSQGHTVAIDNYGNSTIIFKNAKSPDVNYHPLNDTIKGLLPYAPPINNG